MAEKPNKKMEEAIMPSPYFHEPCSKLLKIPNMPTIKAIHAIILIAAGTINDSLLFSLYFFYLEVVYIFRVNCHNVEFGKFNSLHFKDILYSLYRRFRTKVTKIDCFNSGIII